ncbi:MAG: FeoB-associated Cys-rich membrane protein [Methanomassiliicoccaceae archaeon]|nr:FeoB-associated Cys-rich membrane protein [Methanomassiliicoccaceae archaeon]
MSDAATIIAGAVVLIVLIISLYFMIKSIKGGGCNNCEGCPDRKRSGGECPMKKDTKPR